MTTDTISPEVTMTLEEAVGEVLVLLTGQTLTYDPDLDRFRAITGHLNRALRTNAIEQEWGYYHELLQVGAVTAGDQEFQITADYRFRVIGDDAIRLLDDVGIPVVWGYFLPRDALHKYRNRNGLWCAFTRTTLTLSRPVSTTEEGLVLEVPVMREPAMFTLPADPETPVDPAVLTQPVDFQYPDLITARAAWLYAQSDPVMQPRVQTLEAAMNDLKYAAVERDTQFTESPYQNEFIVPVQNSIYDEDTGRPWPVSNRR